LSSLLCHVYKVLGTYLYISVSLLAVLSHHLLSPSFGYQHPLLIFSTMSPFPLEKVPDSFHQLHSSLLISYFLFISSSSSSLSLIPYIPFHHRLLLLSTELSSLTPVLFFHACQLLFNFGFVQ